MTDPVTTVREAVAEAKLTVDRPAHPKTPVELLLSTYHAASEQGAQETLVSFAEHGFELTRAEPLDAEQRGRVAALRAARELVGGKSVLGAAGLSMQQASELVPLARFILTGHEAPPPPRRYLTSPLGEAAVLHDQGDVADVLRTPEGLRKAMQDSALARP